MMLIAQLSDVFGIGTTAVKVHDHQSACPRIDGFGDACVVDLERVERGFDESWSQSCGTDSQYRCDECIGRNDDFIAWLHLAECYIGTQNQCECI